MLLTDGVPANRSYDCIIIGSGPAGLSLALALGDANRRVLVLEAGGESEVRGELANAVGYGHFGGSYWNAHTIHALGGTSAVWAGWCSTYNDIDFDNPAVGVSWPIGRADLAPYYPKAAAMLDQNPAFVEFERPLIPGFLYKPFTIGPPTRFGEKYGEVLRKSSSIDVALGCSVIGLSANESRSTVTRVDYFHHGAGAGRRLVVSSDQTVVAASGGLGNARLLLQPRADGARPVGNEGGHVGKFLMEHPHFHRAGELVIDEELDRYWPVAHDVNGAHTIIADGPLMRREGFYGASFQCFSKTEDHALARHFTATTGRRFFHYDLGARVEMLPSESNRVTLTGDRDRSGLYRLAVRCVIDARDFINVEMTLRALGDALIASGKGRVRLNNDRLYRDATGGGHIMGTTRMGTDAATSVVDANCRVHGYDNFFIAGSSVFPTGSYANPTFTLVSLALRLADVVEKRASRR